MSAGMDAEQFFQVMKTRRAIRSYTDEPVADDDLWKIVQAGRWAANGGNVHPHRFLITRDPVKIRLIRSFIARDAGRAAGDHRALDRYDAAERIGWNMRKGGYVQWVDTGTAAQNMMNMAHALGLGTCPVTSYSHAGIKGVLGLPPHIEPELMLMVGHPRPVERGLNPNAPKPLTTRDLTFWEEVGKHDPGSTTG